MVTVNYEYNPPITMFKLMFLKIFLIRSFGIGNYIMDWKPKAKILKKEAVDRRCSVKRIF